MGDAIVKVENLSKNYGKFAALRNVSFTLPRGKIVGLIGPNGAGKTSLLKILSCLMPATAGRVSVCDIDLAEHPTPVKGKISFMLENNPLPDHMRVGEYLRFRAALKGIRGVRLRTEKVMRKCDIYHSARHSMIRNLSKGYRQRVGIADALLRDSELIILDEPTIGLDPKQIIEVRKTLLEFRGSHTLLISSHILAELETICDYFVIINGGEVVATGSLADISTLSLNSNIMRIDVALQGVSDEIVGDFLARNHLVALETNADVNLNRLRIKLRANDGCVGSIVKSAADCFGEALLSADRESPSLEEIFLSATKRYRD
jgi:ABC-2 type transport system ATP-binding protein